MTAFHHGLRLKRLIENSGKSISAIATKSGVVRASIYNYFTYEDLPRKKIKPLLEVLKIDVDNFYNEKKFESIVNEREHPYGLHEKVKDLEDQIVMLREQLADKNEIIQFLKTKEKKAKPAFK